LSKSRLLGRCLKEGFWPSLSARHVLLAAEFFMSRRVAAPLKPAGGGSVPIL